MDKFNVIDFAIEEAKRQKKIILYKPTQELINGKTTSTYSDVYFITFTTIDDVISHIFNLCKRNLVSRQYDIPTCIENVTPSSSMGEKNFIKLYFDERIHILNFSDQYMNYIQLSAGLDKLLKQLQIAI